MFALLESPRVGANSGDAPFTWETTMQSIRYGYLALAALCFIIAVLDANYREFATAGGLFVVAEAILQRRGG